MKTIYRADIAKLLASRTSISPADADDVLDELFGQVVDRRSLGHPGMFQEALSKGMEVWIIGFGKFKREIRKGRKWGWRNRYGGGVVDKPSTYYVQFTPFQALRESVCEQPLEEED